MKSSKGLFLVLSIFEIIKRLSKLLKKDPEIGLEKAMRETMGESALEIALNYVSKEKDLSESQKLDIVEKALIEFEKTKGLFGNKSKD